MTIIQAHKRTKPYTHTFPDVTLRFHPNEHGHVVCDVADQSAVDRLLATPTGFREYADQSGATERPLAALVPSSAPSERSASGVEPLGAPPADEAPLDMSERYVLVSGERSLDLRPMSDEQLHAFCKSNNIKVHPNAKGDTVRDRILAGLAEE